MLRNRSTRSTAGRLLAALATFGTVVVSLHGCSRGPLEDTEEVADAATEEAAPAEAAAPEPETPADASRDAPGVIACAACVAETCGQSILACFQSDECRALFACVASECFGSGSGGGFDPTCMIRCAADGDPTSALQVFAVVQCVMQQCGPDCRSVLDFLGGGSGGGGRRDAGSSDAGGDLDGGEDDAGDGLDGGEDDAGDGLDGGDEDDAGDGLDGGDEDDAGSDPGGEEP